MHILITRLQPKYALDDKRIGQHVYTLAHWFTVKSSLVHKQIAIIQNIYSIGAIRTGVRLYTLYKLVVVSWIEYLFPLSLEDSNLGQYIF